VVIVKRVMIIMPAAVKMIRMSRKD